MSEPLWIAVETVLEIHKRIIEIGPGPSGIRDKGLLVSALDRLKKFFL